MWDELAAAAWMDPSLITKQETRYLSVDIDHGAGYGNTRDLDRARQTQNRRAAGDDSNGIG